MAFWSQERGSSGCVAGANRYHRRVLRWLAPRLCRLQVPCGLAVALAFHATLAACATTGASSGFSSAHHRHQGLLQWSTDGETLNINQQGSIRPLKAPPRIQDELERIPGAVITFSGSILGPEVRIAAFRMVEAPDGMTPWVGRLLTDQSGVMLEDEVNRVRLALQGKALHRLKRQHGARIWVTGSVVGPHVLLVAHWGVLEPAPRIQEPILFHSAPEAEIPTRPLAPSSDGRNHP